MSEVSTRAFGFYLALEREGRVDVDALLTGLPVARAELEDPRARISWELFREITERYGRTLGGNAAIVAAGEAAIAPGYLGTLMQLVGRFTDARDIYRIGIRWFAPSMYRNLRFDLQDPRAGPLRVTVEIPAEYPGSEAFMLMTQGGLRVLPRLLGLPDAVVEATITPHHGRFDIVLPPPRGARSFLSRIAATVRGADAIVSELAEQQTQIVESYAAMARAERGLGSVLEALPVAVGVFRHGVLLYANPALTRLVDNDALVGAPVESLVPHDERAALEGLLRAADPTRTIELRLGTADQEAFVECGVLDGFVYQGDRAGLLFAIDLTPRRVALHALARSEELTRVLLAVLPDLLLRIDRNGTLIDFRAGRDLRNADLLAPLVGHSIRGLAALLPALGRELIEHGMVKVREALDAGKETTYAVQTNALGTPRWYGARIFPDAGNEVVILVRDTTAAKRAEEQQAITERMATLGTIAAGVAHELNNPLTYVLANIALALDEIEGAERGRPLDLAALRQGLRDAQEGGVRVCRIVGDLRVFSRAGSTDDRRPTDVGEVLESVIAMTQPETRARARIVTEIEGTARVDADPSRLGQVFVNLVINAAQAIAEGSGSPHEIRVRACVDGDGWQRVEIRDDGCGIAPEQLGQIFQPFVTSKANQGGTGLGLAICHRIVTELGGTIEVESTLDVGTTFRVRLPPCRHAPPQIEPAQGECPPARSSAPQPARILLVDDEALVARALTRSLAGHDVTWVASGEAALERLQDGEFDLVLCDLTLGGMGGLDVREAVRERDPALAERFLFVTGGALTAAARDLIAAEPERCIGKPVAPDELRARVAAALHRHR